MKIAFVYDRVNKFGGAERVLLALHEIWPEAPLFTAIYNKEKAKWAQNFRIIASPLNRIPFTSTNHEMLPLLTPYAFEMLNFDDYDVVLSITSADAKGIITHLGTLHICYLLTPTRYLWNGYTDHIDNPGFGILNPFVSVGMRLFSPSLRRWDFIAARKPDYFIAISDTVNKRINAYYKRTANIIYPPVDIDRFTPAKIKTSDDYFLIVSRLVPYKKIDIAISAFNKLGWKLKIIGNGVDENRLRNNADVSIEFINSGLTDKKLCWYYQNCKGLIFPGEEDFGIAAVEAQACGKPVLTVREGGVSEIIVPGTTGEVCKIDDVDSMIFALKKFRQKKYLAAECRSNALRFSKQRFKKEMKSIVENYWKAFLRRN